MSSSNHPFSGAAMLVSGRVYTPNIFIYWLYQIKLGGSWIGEANRSTFQRRLFLAKVYSHSPQMMTEMCDWCISVRQDRWRWSEGAYSKWFDLQCSLPYAQVLLGHIFHIAITTWLQTERADASIPVDLFVNFLESIEILWHFMRFGCQGCQQERVVTPMVLDRDYVLQKWTCWSAWHFVYRGCLVCAFNDYTFPMYSLKWWYLLYFDSSVPGSMWYYMMTELRDSK